MLIKWQKQTWNDNKRNTEIKFWMFLFITCEKHLKRGHIFFLFCWKTSSQCCKQGNDPDPDHLPIHQHTLHVLILEPHLNCLPLPLHRSPRAPPPHFFFFKPNLQVPSPSPGQCWVPRSNFHPLVIYFPGLCALSNNWTIHSMVTRTMFPPARPAPTWPRSWRSTPRPASTTAPSTAATTTKCTGNGPSHPKFTDKETPLPKDTMVLIHYTCPTQDFYFFILCF